MQFWKQILIISLHLDILPLKNCNFFISTTQNLRNLKPQPKNKYFGKGWRGPGIVFSSGISFHLLSCEWWCTQWGVTETKAEEGQTRIAKTYSDSVAIYHNLFSLLVFLFVHRPKFIRMFCKWKFTLQGLLSQFMPSQVLWKEGSV